MTKRMVQGGGFLTAVFESPTDVAGLHDVAMVRQAIEHCSRHFGVTKNLWQVGQGEVYGDQQRCVFVEFADQMEQQLSAGLTKWQIPELVDSC